MQAVYLSHNLVTLKKIHLQLNADKHGFLICVHEIKTVLGINALCCLVVILEISLCIFSYASVEAFGMTLI